MNRTALGTVIALVAGLVLLSAAPASVEASVEVSAGAGYSCAIRVDQTITCWGLDDHGEGTPRSGPSPRSTPAPITPARSGPTARLSAGQQRGRRGHAALRRPSPRSVPAATTVVGLRTDSTLACWGRNTQSPPFNVAPAGNFRAVSAGNTAGTTWSCAVETAGSIICWATTPSAEAILPRGRSSMPAPVAPMDVRSHPTPTFPAGAGTRRTEPRLQPRRQDSSVP